MGKANFQDWLQQQTKNRPSEQEIARKLAEWLDALASLYAQMHDWLRQDDPAGVIKIRETSEPVEEEELGVYSAPALRFMMNHRMAAAVPVARNVLGPARAAAGPAPTVRGEGRVDLRGGVGSIHLYRVRDPDGTRRWVVMDQDQLTFKDFDKDAFEDALQRLLS